MLEHNYESAVEELGDLGLTEDQIDAVWIWHSQTLRAQVQTTGGVVIVRLLTYLLGGHTDARIAVRLAGLAWGFGLGHLTGHPHAADHAHTLGVSRQAIAEAAKGARKALDPR